MNKSSKDFLYKLLQTPSPSGFEQKIQRVVKKRMESYAESMHIDLHGNLIVGYNTDAKLKVMLAGHCDQIGFMVKHVSKEGYIYVGKVGGIDTHVLPGTIVAIQSEKGVIQGVMGKTPIHLTSADERAKLAIDMDKVWIDIGAKDEKDALKKVSIGDPVVFQPVITELQNGLISGPGLDDRVGLFVAMEAFRLLAKKSTKVGVYAVSTVQEEVGLRGARTAAHSIDPTVGIAIDVTFADDNPGKGKAKLSPCSLGKGPCVVRGPNINPIVEKRLMAAAKKAKIAIQPQVSSGLLGNDANAIQVSRDGVATGSIGIPNRYMHTQVEVVSLKDLENSAKLLAEFVRGITPSTSFIPR